ncbi:hypothetical protein HDU67_000049 [Dinochytrium kinnereticum]|nr:hypothetical protein HDU67_000049 [Dinochytrium kinnereticum]
MSGVLDKPQLHYTLEEGGEDGSEDDERGSEGGESDEGVGELDGLEAVGSEITLMEKKTDVGAGAAVGFQELKEKVELGGQGMHPEDSALASETATLEARSPSHLSEDAQHHRHHHAGANHHLTNSHSHIFPSAPYHPLSPSPSLTPPSASVQRSPISQHPQPQHHVSETLPESLKDHKRPSSSDQNGGGGSEPEQIVSTVEDGDETASCSGSEGRTGEKEGREGGGQEDLGIEGCGGSSSSVMVLAAVAAAAAAADASDADLSGMMIIGRRKHSLKEFVDAMRDAFEQDQNGPMEDGAAKKESEGDEDDHPDARGRKRRRSGDGKAENEERERTRPRTGDASDEDEVDDEVYELSSSESSESSGRSSSLSSSSASEDDEQMEQPMLGESETVVKGEEAAVALTTKRVRKPRRPWPGEALSADEGKISVRGGGVSKTSRAGAAASSSRKRGGRGASATRGASHHGRGKTKGAPPSPVLEGMTTVTSTENGDGALPPAATQRSSARGRGAAGSGRRSRRGSSGRGGAPSSATLGESGRVTKPTAHSRGGGRARAASGSSSLAASRMPVCRAKDEDQDEGDDDTEGENWSRRSSVLSVARADRGPPSGLEMVAAVAAAAATAGPEEGESGGASPAVYQSVVHGANAVPLPGHHPSHHRLNPSPHLRGGGNPSPGQPPRLPSLGTFFPIPSPSPSHATPHHHTPNPPSTSYVAPPPAAPVAQPIPSPHQQQYEPSTRPGANPTKPYVCSVPWCNKSYKKLNGLINHGLTAHPSASVTPLAVGSGGDEANARRGGVAAGSGGGRGGSVVGVVGGRTAVPILGRVSVGGIEGVKVAFGRDEKPFVCTFDGCGKRYRNSNGLENGHKDYVTVRERREARLTTPTSTIPSSVASTATASAHQPVRAPPRQSVPHDDSQRARIPPAGPPTTASTAGHLSSTSSGEGEEEESRRGGGRGRRGSGVGVSGVEKGREERKFLCPFVGCGRAYKNKNGLVYHLEKGKSAQQHRGMRLHQGMYPNTSASPTIQALAGGMVTANSPSTSSTQQPSASTTPPTLMVTTPTTTTTTSGRVATLEDIVAALSSASAAAGNVHQVQGGGGTGGSGGGGGQGVGAGSGGGLPLLPSPMPVPVGADVKVDGDGEIPGCKQSYKNESALVYHG